MFHWYPKKKSCVQSVCYFWCSSRSKAFLVWCCFLWKGHLKSSIVAPKTKPFGFSCSASSFSLFSFYWVNRSFFFFIARWWEIPDSSLSWFLEFPTLSLSLSYFLLSFLVALKNSLLFLWYPTFAQTFCLLLFSIMIWESWAWILREEEENSATLNQHCQLCTLLPSSYRAQWPIIIFISN